MNSLLNIIVFDFSRINVQRYTSDFEYLDIQYETHWNISEYKNKIVGIY